MTFDSPKEPHRGSPLAGKVAIVTGASRGIGRAIALRFVREGYTVWGLARDRGALESLGREAASGPGNLVALPVDLAGEERAGLGHRGRWWGRT